MPRCRRRPLRHRGARFPDDGGARPDSWALLSDAIPIHPDSRWRRIRPTARRTGNQSLVVRDRALKVVDKELRSERSNTRLGLVRHCYTFSSAGLNGSTFSRKPRELKLEDLPSPSRALGGCNALLCRFRVWDFQITTDFNNQKIINLLMPRN